MTYCIDCKNAMSPLAPRTMYYSESCQGCGVPFLHVKEEHRIALADPRGSFSKDSGRVAKQLVDCHPYGVRQQFYDILQRIAYRLGYQKKVNE